MARYSNWRRLKNVLGVVIQLTFIVLSLPSVVQGETTTDEDDRSHLVFPMEKPRMVSVEELEKYDGEGHEGIIWLSILGEVYDVTKGAGYYKKGMGYSIFAARDGSVPFITGKFTPEEAEKSILDTLTDAQLYALNDWRNFYEGEEKYPFVGLLEGGYFNEDGGPTETMTKIRTMIRNYVPRSVRRKQEREEKEREEKKAAAAKKARAERSESNVAAAADSVAKGAKESVEPMAPKQGSSKSYRDDDNDPSRKTSRVEGEL